MTTGAGPAGHGGYDARFAALAASARVAELLREPGDDDVEPFSFVPVAGLRALARELALEPGGHLVDLGCGRGGPGLLLAGALGARLTGVDGSHVALRHAAERAPGFVPSGRARFALGDLTDTGLPGGCADALLCVDAFHLADAPGVAREIARLLAPGAPCAITCWESERVERYPERVADTLRDAGLRIRTDEARADWLERQLRIYRGAARAAATTPDDPALSALAAEGRAFTAVVAYVRRVLVIATEATCES